MKTTLAILCSLLIAWTQVVPAQATAAATRVVTPACCHCRQSSCCVARPAPTAPPVSSAPVPASPQNQLLIFASVALAWTLPAAESRELSVFLISPAVSASAPLYARDCAWLI